MGRKYFIKTYVLDDNLMNLERIINNPNYRDYQLVNVIKDKGVADKDIYVAFLQKEDK